MVSSTNNIIDLESNMIKLESEISNKLIKCSKIQLEHAEKKKELANSFQGCSETLIKLVDLKKLYKADNVIEIRDEEISRYRQMAFLIMKISEAEIEIVDAMINVAKKTQEIGMKREKISKIYKDLVKYRKNYVKKITELIKAKEDYEKNKNIPGKEITLEETINKKTIEMQKAFTPLSDTLTLLISNNTELENLENELSDLNEVLSKRLSELDKIRSPEKV
ncbi:MAG: hypothetical protein ACTSVY_02860 [Candidatus Helarchaeota archaeon]